MFKEDKGELRGSGAFVFEEEEDRLLDSDESSGLLKYFSSSFSFNLLDFRGG